MRRYLVVAHRTLGGAHLMDHLHRLRVDDPYCRFHLVVPRHVPEHPSYEPEEIESTARRELDDILDRMASMGMGATGETGDRDPVEAVAAAVDRLTDLRIAGIVLSTLPRGRSTWIRGDVPDRMRTRFPTIPLAHLIADEVAVA